MARRFPVLIRYTVHTIVRADILAKSADDAIDKAERSVSGQGAARSTEFVSDDEEVDFAIEGEHWR